ncbi:MAG TPA: sugar transferase [Terracidiphilus sp.]
MTATILAAIAVACLSRFMADELKAWFGWAHRSLRRLAVNRLPHIHRDRYAEEWESEVEEIPGEMLRLFYSIGLLLAAYRMNLVYEHNASTSGEADRLPSESWNFNHVKRIVDFCVSFSALVSLAPLFALISAVIALTSDGPVVVGITHIGQYGRPFSRFKFRTVSLDCDGPRIDFVGRFLRRFSLDELPQFINVIRGEMSLVGPRPITPQTREYLDSLRKQYTEAIPGITGPMQVSDEGRSYREYLELEALYFRRKSILYDFKILLKTLLNAFKDWRI